MTFRKTYLAAILAALLVPVGALANGIDPAVEFYSANRAANPIVLDGDLSEWTGISVIENPEFGLGADGVDGGATFEPWDGGTWTGPADQSSNIQITWDDDNVYLGLVVTDDYHENAANSGWNGDSAQIHIANDARDTQVALYNYALGGVEGATGDVVIQHEAGPGGTDAVVTRSGTTTTYEIQFPKASINLADLSAGVELGIGMAINDGDEGEPGQRGWGGLGPHALVFGKTPSETALVTLVPEPSTGLSLLAMSAILFLRRKR